MMLSSSTRRGDSERCRKVGISIHLVKPIKQSELYDAIINTLSMQNTKEKDQKKKVEKQDKSVKEKEKAMAVTDRPSVKILLAEDNAINRKLAESLIHKKGWEVVSVSDGEKAVHLLESTDFDLVLMDVQMPLMDGFEATAVIRQREKSTGAHVPIIAMTAHAIKGDKEKCLDHGMDDYISKPMKAEDLYNAVEKWTKGREEKDEASSAELPDLSKVMDTVDGDKELLKELVGDFLKEYPKQLDELREVIERGDSQQLARSAHSFKGAVGNFGVKSAYDLAYQLETLGGESRMDTAITVFKKLEKEMVQVRSFFSMPDWENNL